MASDWGALNIIGRLLTRYGLLLGFLFFAGIGYSVLHERWGAPLDWPRRSLGEVQALEAASGRLQVDIAEYQKTSRTILDDQALRSAARIDARLASIRSELAADRMNDRRSGGIAGQLLRGGADEVIRVHRNRLRIRQLEIETAFLRDLRRPVSIARAMTDWEQRTKAEVNRRSRVCASLRQSADALSHQWFWRRYRLPDLQDRVADLRHRSAAACASANSLARRFVQVELSRRRVETAIRNLPAAAGSYADVIADVLMALSDRWLFSSKLWLKAHHASHHLEIALIGVALAMVMPLLIRILFYVALAPLAARRPPIWLLPDSTPMRAAGEHSAVSQDVIVPAGWELLVKQGYLHHAPVGGQASTRWLLDWHTPIGSVVRGLVFLTRYRNLPRAAQAGISAGGDPFAELLQLRLEQGQACMLLPRLVVAIVQPAGRSIKITRHWRLGSPHAWLTGQLRFLVFHGPAMLVLKGYRGLHGVNADHDLELPQGHVVGFSANLAYGTVRAGTFQPYFLKQDSLLRDVVRSGPGLVLTEEAPSLAGQSGRSGHTSHRMEDALDILLKFVGL